MELFSKIINGFQPLTVLAKSSILDVWQGSECATYRHLLFDVLLLWVFNNRNALFYLFYHFGLIVFWVNEWSLGKKFIFSLWRCLWLWKLLPDCTLEDSCVNIKLTHVRPKAFWRFQGGIEMENWAKAG